MGSVPRLTDGSVPARVALAADLVALCVFVLAGVRSHHETTGLAAFARTAVPFGGAWLVAAGVLRTHRPPSTGRLVKTWSIAVPAGVALRALWVGSEGTRVLVFLIVAMAFTLAFLLAGRGMARAAASRLRRSRPAGQ
jgi:hypothetical protein